MPQQTDTQNSSIVATDFSKDGSSARMTSREIAELVDKRHDNVKRTIETLAASGVISLPQIEEVKIQRERRIETASVYAFSGEQGKRDSIVVVAQLCPEFTARLVDRWRELEGRLRSLQAAPSANAAVARETRLTYAWLERLAKASGLAGNQACLSACQGTHKMTGVNPLGLMGITHMPAPVNEALLTPTEIGQRVGNGSPRKINQLLCDLGLQEAFRDAKGHVYYEPTEAGRRAGGVMQDTAKRHSTGTPVRQLRWASSIVHQIQAAA